MMVSKVAVVALVAILAVPILMGYGFNLSESTKADYKTNNDSVNVTGLLNNGTAYTAAAGTIYQLNTNFENRIPDYPLYQSTGISTATSLPLTTTVTNYGGGYQGLLGLDLYYIAFDLAYSASVYVTVKLYHDSTVIATIDHVAYVLYERDIDTVSYLKLYPNGDSTSSYYNDDYNGLEFVLTGTNSVSIRYGYVISQSGTPQYTDISAGYYFYHMAYESSSYWYINLPEKTFDALMTVNLNSITDANYTLTIQGIFKLEKTTSIGGVVSWKVTNTYLGGNQYYDLYYNPNYSDNTYQILLQHYDRSEPSATPGSTNYYRNVEFRYVGHWPTIIGEANYYQKYSFDYIFSSSIGNDLNKISLSFSQRTPIMRMDNAHFRAFEYQAIDNNTYYPSTFKDNPATTITNIQKYGTSITFGGHQYAVNKEGKITIDSHDVSIDKLVFKSVPNGSGGYDNKIGNTLISTSVQPSTIIFGGKWVASVDTQSMQQFTYTSTDWTPGQFAWDGIDQNFLMIGLLAALGVFIALGIAYRKTKAALGALLIVCGGAAVLFFTML